MREDSGAGLWRPSRRPFAAAASFAVRRLLLWLIAALVFSQAPALADDRDRPGTPNNPAVYECGAHNDMATPKLCFTFRNTAGRDVVHFEIEMNGMLLDRSRQICSLDFTAGSPDGTGCIVENSGNQGFALGNMSLGIEVIDLQFDTNYCFRVRTRRADDQVVSLLWSNQVCTRTKQKPPPPLKPTIDAKFFTSEVHIYCGYNVNTNKKGSCSIGGNRDAVKSEPNVDYYTYLLSGSGADDKIPVGLCTENISGKQCGNYIVWVKEHTVYDADGPAPVIKHTGQAPGEPSQRPHTPDGPGPFLGVWNTQTGQNAHFRVTFSVSNGVLVGKFENLDNSPQYNGTLTQKPGTEIKDGQLLYTYEQPATKGSGTGQFMIFDGNRMVGQIVTNDNPPIKTAWFGNKAGAPPAPGAR